MTFQHYQTRRLKCYVLTNDLINYDVCVFHNPLFKILGGVWIKPNISIQAGGLYEFPDLDSDLKSYIYWLSGRKGQTTQT